jgi:hypothetical protein
LALPAGDPTPGTLAPLVTIVTPMDGTVVGARIRVQARVHHPSGLAALSSVRVAASGSSALDVGMAPLTAFALGPETAIFEAIVELTPGATTLVATATDSAGRSTNSAAVAVTASAGRGDGFLLVRDNSSQLCGACHDVASHGSETSGRTYGAWSTTCRDCHQPHRTRNLALVAETIRPPWVFGSTAPSARAVKFSRRIGYAPAGGATAPDQASFANGDATGPCQVCHTRTVRWPGGGAADAVHLGDCGFCHRHKKGFESACTDCHSTPPATGAHAAHHGASAPAPPFPSDPRPLGCGSCHPTDPALHGDGAQQIVLSQALVLPGGTRTTGAVLAGAPAATTCLIACHFPLGAATPAAPIAWNATGPLPCTSCHSSINPTGAAPTARAGPSLHDPIFSEARPASGEPTACFTCHDTGAHDASHLTGAPGLLASGTIDAACIACHAPPSGPATGPQGQVLHAGSSAATSKTPPVLPGWSTTTVDAATGDFHGGRRGTCFGGLGPAPCAPTATPTGYGGTLKAPWSRGQNAMPCTACHAGHASANSFLFAPVVNGTPIPAGAIDRTGAGAEKLCEACHAGDRHEKCRACHTDAYYCDSGQCWMDDAANHIDPAPAGSACFFCHGHEGIVKWTSPYGPHGTPPTDCRHCHGGLGTNGGRPPTWVPPQPAPPTLINGLPRVTSITSTSAVVSWDTATSASTWVEYGVGMPGWVKGSADEVRGHSVKLTGLQAGTAYVWRVRSVDAYRNFLRSSIATLTTTVAGAVPYPDIVPVGWTGVVQPANTMVVGLTWYPVASPTGNPVEYRVQLAEDPGFTTLVNGSPPDSGWIPGTPGTLSGVEVRSFGATLTNLPPDWCAEEIPYNQYYWRVKARDSVTGVESEWSAVDPFRATSADPYGC